jgi:hypothetical protein
MFTTQMTWLFVLVSTYHFRTKTMSLYSWNFRNTNLSVQMIISATCFTNTTSIAIWDEQSTHTEEPDHTYTPSLWQKYLYIEIQASQISSGGLQISSLIRHFCLEAVHVAPHERCLLLSRATRPLKSDVCLRISSLTGLVRPVLPAAFFIRRWSTNLLGTTIYILI